MSTDRRNPYLVLGVPYGATREDATAAFAARSRRARREPDFPYTIDDLTWALNQVEDRIKNPASDVDTFRVPADTDALRPPSGPGVLRLKPTPLARRTGPVTPQLIDELHSRAVNEAILEALAAEADEVADYLGFTAPVSRVTLSIIEPPAPKSAGRSKSASKPEGRRSWWSFFGSFAGLVSMTALLCCVGGILAVKCSGNDLLLVMPASARSFHPW